MRREWKPVHAEGLRWETLDGEYMVQSDKLRGEFPDAMIRVIDEPGASITDVARRVERERP